MADKKQDAYYQKAWDGDYTDFDKMTPDRREDLAEKYMQAMWERNPRMGDGLSNDREVTNLLKEQSTNPLFRLGCSLRAEKDDQLAPIYREYDNFMSKHVKEQSLSPVENIGIPPKKPGFMTRLKSSLGSPEAKNICQEHKTYQTALKDRQNQIKAGGQKTAAQKHSMKELKGSLDGTGWQYTRPFRSLDRYGRSPKWSHEPIAAQRSPLFKKIDISEIERVGGSMIPPESKEPAASVIPPQPKQPEVSTVSPEPKIDNATILAFLTQQNGASMIPPETVEKQGMSLIKPEMMADLEAFNAARQNEKQPEASMIPPSQNNKEASKTEHKVPYSFPELKGNGPAAPAQRHKPEATAQKNQEISKPAPTKSVPKAR